MYDVKENKKKRKEKTDSALHATCWNVGIKFLFSAPFECIIQCESKGFLIFSQWLRIFKRNFAEYGILGYLLPFLIKSRADFHDTRRNDWRRQWTWPTQHFGSDLAHIRIWINPEVRSRIPDNFRLRLDALAEVCALWVQSSLPYANISN